MQRSEPPRPARWLVTALAVGFLYGWLTWRIPSPTPSRPHDFWVANLAAPWLVMPFAAGWLQRSRTRSAIAGSLADIGASAGFYLSILLADPHPGPRGRRTPIPDRIIQNWMYWLQYLAPWIALSVLVGGVLGVLGCWRRRSGSAVPAAVIGLALLTEPLVLITLRGYRVPVPIWSAEMLVGVCVMVIAIRSHRRTVPQL